MAITAGTTPVTVTDSTTGEKKTQHHNEIVAIYKDLEAMREFYHNDLHNEATQFTNGNTTIANMVSARVAKVPAERMPYFTGGCMGCTFPFSFGTSKAFIMECREK